MIPAADPSPDPAASPWQVLRYPQSSAVTFGLLAAAVLLTTVFVGDWLFLSLGAAAPGELPPPEWLVTPPAVAVVLTAVLVAAAPRILERHRCLVPVPPDVGAAALHRVNALAAELGLRTSPRLLWNSRQASASAFAYGRPGNYRLALAPTMLGIARRHPQRFDDVARHELAHIRYGDVLMALSALYCWYAVLPVLAAPLVVRLLDDDWSLVPDYLVRAAAIAAVVYLIRAKLLRSRETWADVIAASRSGDPSAMADRLRAAGQAARGWGGPGATLLALHPAPAERADSITHPAWLGRPDPGEWLGVGILSGASVPLVRDLLTGADPTAIVQSDTAARALVYAAAGCYATLTLARAAGTGGLTRRDPVRLAVMLALGVVLGAALSLGRTGLVTALFPDVVDAAVTAVAAVSVVVLVGALARVPAASAARPLRLVAFTLTAAVLTGLAAAASLTLSTVVAQTGAVPGPTHLLFVLDPGWTARLVALGCLAAALAGLALAHAFPAVRTPAAAAAAVGLGQTALLSAVRPLLGDLHEDERSWAYYLVWIWLAVGLSVLVGMATTALRNEGVLAGIPAAALVAITAAAGFVVSADAFGGQFTVIDAVSSLALISGATIAIGLPLSAATLFLPGPGPARRPRSMSR